MEKINKFAELTLTVVCIVLVINLAMFIHNAAKELTETNVTEYQYKDFTDKDINLAMKFHGISACTVSEKEVYFMRKHKKHNLFTDEAIEYIIKEKKKSLTQ